MNNKKIISKFIFTSLIIISIPLIYWVFNINNLADGNNKDVTVDNKDFVESKKFKDGDIIFQTSQSSQSKAIQIATKSKYSHVGIIYSITNKFYVYEAIQPVKLTALNEWINRGLNGKYVVKRLIDAEKILTPDILLRMKDIGNKYINKDYDLFFEWSDKKMYCSELVWKIYKKGANIEIGELQNLEDFNLSNKDVKKILNKRYGDNIPLKETVISPVAIFNSEKLRTIAKN